MIIDKKFFFTDEINIANLDRETKKKIVFGDVSNLLVSSVPPGLKVSLAAPKFF